jgi:hypothetical protein
MKKIICSLLSGSILLLTGCLETTEITLKADGSGMVKITADISALTTIIKSMAGSSAGKSDTTYQLSVWVDSIDALTAAEKEMVRVGYVHTNFDTENEKQIISFSYPFASLAEIPKLYKFSNKVMFRFAQKFNPEGASIPFDRIADCAPFDDYFNTTFSNEMINKKIIKEKTADIEKDTCIKAMSNADNIGMGIISTRIIHLPRPVKKAEGENITLSKDKKTVTIKAVPGDFYKDPEKMEFRIEY